MKNRKSWREKLEASKDLPKVVPIPQRMRKTWGQGTIVIPAPQEIDALMRQVPKGKLTTTGHIREAIAKAHGATMGCPMTTGIFAWIAAHAAAETEAAKPNARITPYWRTLKAGGALNEKYPGGVASQKKRLQREGHTVKSNGKSEIVVDFDLKLFKFK